MAKVRTRRSNVYITSMVFLSSALAKIMNWVIRAKRLKANFSSPMLP